MAEAISLLAINAFACSVISCSEVRAEAISSLTINTFVCCVILCLEVSSRGYLVASDDVLVCSVISYSEVKQVAFENWLRNPPKRTETRGKSF